jgi:hypothetical protein
MGCFVLGRLVGGFVVGLEESVVSLALSAAHLLRAVDLSAARSVDSLTGLFGDLMVV